MSTAPARLPACPLCSTRGHIQGRPFLETPCWKFAHNTSAKRRVKCWIWVGCQHAQPLSSGFQIVEEGAAVKQVEQAWQARAADLFMAQTAGWSAAQREEWRSMLLDRAWLPGATEPRELQFAPDS